MSFVNKIRRVRRRWCYFYFEIVTPKNGRLVCLPNTRGFEFMGLGRSKTCFCFSIVPRLRWCLYGVKTARAVTPRLRFGRATTKSKQNKFMFRRRTNKSSCSLAYGPFSRRPKDFSVSTVRARFSINSERNKVQIFTEKKKPFLERKTFGNIGTGTETCWDNIRNGTETFVAISPIGTGTQNLFRIVSEGGTRIGTDTSKHWFLGFFFFFRGCFRFYCIVLHCNPV